MFFKFIEINVIANCKLLSSSEPLSGEIYPAIVQMQKEWNSLDGKIDDEKFEFVKGKIESS